MTNKYPHETKSLNKKSDEDKIGDINDETISLNAETNSVMITHKAIDEITNFSLNAMPKEAIGLLSGREIRPRELLITKGLFVTEGEEYSVSFSESDFQIFDQVSSPEFCVGWWHSHPGFGLFLSQTDITTHIFSFQLVQPLSVALVVDPMDIGDDGIAKYKFFQIVGDSRNRDFQYIEIASYLSVSSE